MHPGIATIAEKAQLNGNMIDSHYSHRRDKVVVPHRDSTSK